MFLEKSRKTYPINTKDIVSAAIINIYMIKVFSACTAY